MSRQRGGLGLLELIMGSAEVGSELGKSKDYKRMGATGATGHYSDPGREMRLDMARRRRRGGAIGIDGYFTKKQWKDYLKRTGKTYGRPWGYRGRGLKGGAIGIDGYFTKKQWEDYLKRTGKTYGRPWGYTGRGLGALFKPLTKTLGKKVVKIAGKKVAAKAAKKALKKGGKKAVQKAGKKILKKAAKKGTKKIAKKTLVSLGTSAGTALATGAIATGIESAINGKPKQASITPKAADSTPVVAIPTPPPPAKKKKRKRQ